ncbi:MAG: hypothetical protein H6766_00395 [Candidatus Peribacteria bacterium]|nr:MAG: hypothetical protein H6766_00395 [Candidatus Peribacteria bacterium]
MMRGTPTIRDMQGGRRIGLTHLTNMADVIYEWIVDGEVVTNDTDNTIMILGDTGMHTIIATIDDLTTQTSISCDDTYCINATLQTQ